jgi:hypothetical protein
VRGVEMLRNTVILLALSLAIKTAAFATGEIFTGDPLDASRCTMHKDLKFSFKMQKSKPKKAGPLPQRWMACPMPSLQQRWPILASA